MSHARMSQEARETYMERRATNRERTIVRRAERHGKHVARVAFGGAR